ncbi:MAG TPA: thrombospondin type 3 repeat-containing protein [Kiritimatiellia bacterium]|nr:thrombospondin type 3 repeat-containing protein [Kiritimatiellia bacterium]HOM58770.1 thrombospondin type 3 repeat-containing protein [Kiritimatiellia bacterium]HOR97743.1 thrombospondin type 3 repeat-containing protein [Kiritimatiellia bacterium]HPW75953.1 thrombospondin type 3 repeat-containing protein [Kiritimatiellia bacterium]HRU19677.1 thrombospondin type 3 repeat-containing protein [Kiritimatiellia bacterium]
MAIKLSSFPLLRHYDKLIAIGVLIFLLISLFYLTHVGAARKQAESQYTRQLESLKPTAAPLAAIEMAEFDDAVRLVRSPLQLDTAETQKAGFLTPERRVVCVIQACKKPIPYAAEVCPFCGGKQPIPPDMDVGLDTDRDGIPDKEEIRLGLNPLDPADAKGDLDGDGFSNLEEFLAGTDPKDPKSHPALVNLLRVKELRGKRLPLIFSGVNKMPDGKLQLVFNQTAPIPRTFWIREGERIGDSDYVAEQVEIKFEDRDNPRMPGLKMRVDVSRVTLLRQSDKKKIVLQINERDKNTDIEAVIVLPLDQTEYTVIENSTLKVREETYRVLTIDADTTTVIIESQATGQQKVVRKLDS